MTERLPRCKPKFASLSVITSKCGDDWAWGKIMEKHTGCSDRRNWALQILYRKFMNEIVWNFWSSHSPSKQHSTPNLQRSVCALSSESIRKLRCWCLSWTIWSWRTVKEPPCIRSCRCSPDAYLYPSRTGMSRCCCQGAGWHLPHLSCQKLRLGGPGNRCYRVYPTMGHSAHHKNANSPVIRWMEEILHHQNDGWNPINGINMDTQPTINWCRISQPSTVWCLEFLMVIFWFFITYITSYIFSPSRLFATVRDILSYVDV